MIGREHDLTRVLDVLQRHRSCALVGPGGIGKSTLLQSVAHSLGDALIRVDVGVSGSVDDVLMRVLEMLDADLDTDLDTDVDEAELTADPNTACDVLARRLSAAGIGLLVVDQVDAGVDLLVGHLARIVDRSDVSVLVASRRHPRIPFGEVVRLGPLATPAFGSTLFGDTFLAAGGAPAVLAASADTVTRLVELAGGVPLAIVVAASQAAIIGPAGAEQILDSRRRSDEGDPVSDTLESSLADLDDGCCQLFEAIGSFRARPSFAELAHVCGTSPAEVAGHVDRLARRCLVEVADGRVEMLPPIRHLAQRSATRHGRDHHIRERQAAWAAEVSRADPPLSTRTIVAVEADLVAAVASALDTDRLDDAAAIAATLDDCFRADLRHRRRLDVLEPVLAACRHASNATDATPAVVDRTIEMLRLTAPARSDVFGAGAALPLVAEARALLARSGAADQHAARLDALHAGFAFVAGDLAATRQLADAALDLASRSGDARAHFGALGMLADVELETGNLARSIELSNQIVSQAPTGLRWLRAYALASVGACEIERGAVSVTSAVATTVAHEAREVGDLDLVGEADWLAAIADPTTEPSASGVCVGERVGRSTIHLQAQIARCVRRLAAGDARSAITLAADCELRADAAPMKSLAIDARLLVGACAVRLGERSEATRAYTAVLDEAVALGYRLRVPDALDGLADVAALAPTGGDRGDGCGRRTQQDQLRAAAELIRSQLGSVARPAPWRPPSPAVRSAPPDGWVEHGTLTPLGLELARHALVDIDVDIAAIPSPLDALSPAERVVADLVAQGLTNREIGERLYVSRRTVESHISHAFQKLGLSSRTQLATLAVAGHRNRHSPPGATTSDGRSATS